MFKKLVSAVLCVMLALTSTTAVFANSDNYMVEAATEYAMPYYYSQLSKKLQKVYSELREAILNCKKSVKLNVSLSDNEIEKIWELITDQDPMTFNVSDASVSYTSSSATFSIKYKYNKETFDKMVAACEAKADKILAKLTDDMSTYKKIRVIHDEIIKNTVYNKETDTCGNIYGTLVKKKGKCDGYAKSFSYVCAKAGIRTVCVTGVAEENHMWSKVYYNKKWYNVDVTWDDPTGYLKNNSTYEYFMISDASIRKSHTEDSSRFTVPKADDDSKNYYKVNKRCAEDLASAKSIIKNGLTSAAKNKVTYYEFQCSSQSVYNQVKNYVNDTEKISSVLKNVKKNTGIKIIPGIYSYSCNDDQYTIKFLIFYEKTSLDKYFTDKNSIDGSMIAALEYYGIK